VLFLRPRVKKDYLKGESRIGGSGRFGERSVVSTATATAAAVAREIAIVILIPSMIVDHDALTALPIALEEHLPVVTCRDPTGPGIWRTRPVPIVPDVVAIDRIPIAFDPHVLRLRRWWWSNVHDLGRRWRTDMDSDRNRCLSLDDGSSNEHACGN
jgi:hypothetical protein